MDAVGSWPAITNTISRVSFDRDMRKAFYFQVQYGEWVFREGWKKVELTMGV